MTQFSIDFRAESQEEWQKELSFFSGFNGLAKSIIDSGRIYQEYPAMTYMLRMTGKISFNNKHPLLTQTENNSIHENMQLPAPAYLLLLILTENEWKRHYLSINELTVDIGSAYNNLLRELYKLGYRHITIKDYSWQPFMDDYHINNLIQGGVDINRYLTMLISVNNLVFDNMPPQMTLTHLICGYDNHTCRLNHNYPFISKELFSLTSK
ncbi:MAG: hypothetical protein NC248_09235 [Bacteroides sp.]|nr:hypothetical protein [Bacteroides sp.]MCM1390154.1 hypothetical protein [Bacteroides sp.]